MEKSKHLVYLSKILLSYIRKKEILGYAPIKLWIETTSRCNLRCGLCINRKLPSSQKKDMDIVLYRGIIDQAAGTVQSVNLFHRGEPLLHPDITHMISYAAGKGIKTSIHTNAVLLNDELSRDIIDAGLDFISFSFDGYSREDYEKKRKGADFDSTMGNIRRFLEIKKELGSNKPDAVIQVMEDTAGDTSAAGSIHKNSFMRAFGDSPPDRIVVRKPHNWGGLLKSPLPAREYSKKRNICTFPWYSLTIFSDGTAYPCPQDFMGTMPVGDVNIDSLHDIFNGPELRKLRKMFRSGRINKVFPCLKCDRIIRTTFMGIPLEYAGSFFRENIHF